MRISLMNTCDLSNEWKFDSDERPATFFGINLEFATKPSDALFNPQQTQAFGIPDIEPTAIILNRETQVFRLLQDLDADRRCMGMSSAIVQRLLNHAVDAGLVIVRQVVGDQICRNGHVHAGLPRHLSCLPFKGWNQT